MYIYGRFAGRLDGRFAGRRRGYIANIPHLFIFACVLTQVEGILNMLAHLRYHIHVCIYV